MNITYHFDEENKIIVITPIGQVNYHNVKETTSVALEVSKQKKCFLLLFDIRKCPVGQGISEAFETIKDLDDVLGLSFLHKTAVIFDPSIYPKERASFIELVVTNRPNPKYKMFSNYEHGVSWLTAK